MSTPLSPPPYRDPNIQSQGWQKWFAQVTQLLSPVASAGLILWTSISKTGSNLLDIATRNHNDLQNIQGGAAGDEQHLTTAQLQFALSNGRIVGQDGEDGHDGVSIQGIQGIRGIQGVPGVGMDGLDGEEGSVYMIPTPSTVCITPEITSASYSQNVFDTDLLVNFAGTVTLTLLNPAGYPGKYLTIRTYQGQLVNSASNNVSLNGVAGSAILAATVGKWAVLKSDSVNWEVITNN